MSSIVLITEDTKEGGKNPYMVPSLKELIS